MTTNEIPSAELPRPSLTGLWALIDDVALIEHSVGGVPDERSGHCVDDAGRALALACRLPDDPIAETLATRCLGFLTDQYLDHGRFRLRDIQRSGDPVISDDANGRAIEGIGIAAALAPWPAVASEAIALFESTTEFASPFLRSRAHALIGATAVLDVDPGHHGATRLVERTLPGLDRWLHSSWPWPEPRLHYANGLLVDALLSAAETTDDERLARRALHMLRWLMSIETQPGHLSPTPVYGRGPGDRAPAFDQQPIEAAHLTAVVARAARLSGDPAWSDLAERCADWFCGINDIGAPMIDSSTGRCYDGLTPTRVNVNQGAESTLSLIQTSLAVEPLRPVDPERFEPPSR